MMKHWTALLTASLATLLIVFAAAPFARADIFQWERFEGAYLESTMLAPDGAGANVVPGADLSLRNLTRAYLVAANLSGANFTQANLTQAAFSGSGGIYSSTPAATLTGANFSHANLRNADFGGYAGFDPADPGIYYYLGADLTGASLVEANLTGTNFVAATLANADLSHTKLNANFTSATLTDANLTGADVRGAGFNRASVVYFPYYNSLFGGITPAQLYSTASYQDHDLTGINLTGNDLTGVNLAGQHLTNASFAYATLTGANLTGADARGANFQYATLTGAITSNLIQSDGHIAGLDLTAGASLVVRDYDGNPAVSAIVIDQHVAIDATGTLRLVFDADPWDSTISFAPGIPVALGGTLELGFAPGVNVATQSGRTIDLFDWTGVTPTGAFTVSSPYTWNLSKLYTTGEITLAAAPSLPGDFNHDGTVDAADYVVWRKGLGTTHTQNDYTIWRAHFGQTAGTGSGATGSASAPAAPEPASLVLFLLSSIALILVPRSWLAAKNRC
ncbi:MAG: pentapeptide repeat-containing protein [Pirellulales bacterium]